ncbi:MAG: N-acetylglucosamine kinase [Chitinophagales bacterium]|nr:N-acetylglucosamine kinase [Chitinophagales bacterium]
MILCADSGSTKTQWLTQTKQLIETIGFNPQFHTTESIHTALQESNDLLQICAQVTKVFFYGAGCSSQSRNAIVANALRTFFPSAEIVIDHDLKAAAYATFSNEPCISCIIGTGSNSCYFDGKTITENVPALGYVLGDEGSGSWFGKELLKQYLYHLLPPKTTRLLQEKYGVEKETVFQRVYREPHANVYLASFAKALSESEDEAYISELVKQGFSQFFKYHVACYPNYQQVPIHFVGSLAFHFKNELQEVANTFNAQLGTVDKAPVYQLLHYHLKNG